MFGDAHANHFGGGIFLVLFSITFIILFGIFTANCDSTVCTIPNTTMLQLTNIKYAIWVPIASLLLIGVFMIAGARNNKLMIMIKNKTFIGLWCNIFPVISLTLLVSSSLLYSVINADGFKCGDVNSPNSKTVYSDLHIQLFHYVTGMISMSAVLFCISVYVLYDFWKETDEQKIQKAKDAVVEFEKIRTISPAGSPKAGMASDLTRLKKALEDGAKLDPEKDLEYYNKMEEIQTYLEKSEGLREAKDKALQEIELSKVTKSAEQQAKSLSAINAKTLLKDFDSIKDDNEKIKAICKYAKSDQQVYEALKQTPFYKTNSEKIEAICGGKQTAYLYDMLEKYKGAQEKRDNITILRTIEEVCKSDLEQSYRTEFFNEVNKKAQFFMTNFGLDIRKVCDLSGPPSPFPGSIPKLVISASIENYTASQPSPVQAHPPVQGPSPVQASPAVQASPDVSISQPGAVKPVVKVLDVSEDLDSAKGSQAPKADTNCSRLALYTRESRDRTRYICNSLGDEGNTGMSDENIVDCLKKNDLIDDTQTLKNLKIDCTIGPSDFKGLRTRQNTGKVSDPNIPISLDVTPSPNVGERRNQQNVILSDDPRERTVQPDNGDVLHFFKTQKKQKAKPKKH
jgi:hypothetical protein